MGDARPAEAGSPAAGADGDQRGHTPQDLLTHQLPLEQGGKQGKSYFKTV